MAASDPSTTALPWRTWDFVFLILAMLLALILALTPADNSDVWLHLATGRAFVEGDYRFGKEPFCYSAEDFYWVNPNWLYDVLTYETYTFFGSSSLVIAKAILLALLAGLLLLMSRNGRGLLLPFVVTGVCLVGMSNQLTLRPIVVSYALFGLIVWLLLRMRQSLCGSKLSNVRNWSEVMRYVGDRYWPILLVMLVWVNVDVWFVLGLFIVMFFAVAQSWRKTTDEDNVPAQRKIVWTLFAGCSLICLVNPHHIHAFRLPTVFGWDETIQVLRTDPSFHYLEASPFRSDHVRSALGHGVNGMVYYLLIVVGILSFIWSFRKSSVFLLLLWIPFFLLSLAYFRTVPFFVVISVPVIVGNYRAITSETAKKDSTAGNAKPVGILGNGFAVLLGIGLIVCAWPNWLQGTPFAPPCWAVPEKPGMDELAQKLRDLQKESPRRVLPFTPQLGNYLAWYCPDVPCHVNEHLAMTPESAKSYLALRKSLTKSTTNLQPLKDNDIRCVVVDMPSTPSGSTNAFVRLVGLQRTWPLVNISGSVAVFVRNEPFDRDLYDSRLPNRFDEMAFSLKKAMKVPPTVTPVPAPSSWWDDFTQPLPNRYAVSRKAGVIVRMFSAEQGTYLRKALTVWRYSHTVPAALAESQPIPGTGIPAGLWLYTDWQLRSNAFAQRMDEGPIAVSYVSLRMARQSLAKHPRDDHAFLVLANAYADLLSKTRERVWANHCQRLSDIRMAQTITALNYCLRIREDNIDAHSALAKVYEQLGYLDLALKHGRAWRDLLIRASTELEMENEEEYHELLTELSKAIEQREQVVAEALAQVEEAGIDQSPMYQAKLAWRAGLVERALQKLTLVDPDAVAKSEDLEHIITLRLYSGHADEVYKAWLDRPAKGFMIWKKLAATLAVGDYQLARKMLRDNLNREGLSTKEQCDLLAIRGWVALEMGDILDARTDFDRALEISSSEVYFEAQALARGGQFLIEQTNPGK